MVKKNRAILSTNQIETKINRALVTRIFPCFKKKGLLGFTPSSY